MDPQKFVVSYAQNREDIILSAFFAGQTAGFYVDVGAADPEEHSVTKYFYDRGWHGVNIEPVHKAYERLNQHRPRDINLNVGVSNTEGKLNLREYKAQGLSTFSKATMQEIAHQKDQLTQDYRDHEVAVTTLKKILKEAGATQIDFMKIDVEGYEYEVIQSNDWDTYRPRVLCIEAEHIHKDWQKILEEYRYKWVYNDGLNDYYVDETKKDSRFDYVNTVVGQPIIPSYAQTTIDDLRRNNQDLRDELKALRKLIEEKEDETLYLNLFIAKNSRLPQLIKNLIAKIDAIIKLQLSKKIGGKKQYPPINVSKQETDPAVILTGIQRADRRLLTTPPPLMRRVVALFFKVVYALYQLLKRSIYRPLRYVKRRLMGANSDEE